MSITTLQGIPFQTVGEPPKVGSVAPEFKVTTIDLQTIKLSDFKGIPLVISTVPCLDTEVCYTTTDKLEKLAHDYPDVGIIIISRDLPPTLKRIGKSSKYDNVLLLSDFNYEHIGKKYGLKIKNGILKGFLARGFIILDKDHKVVQSEVCQKINNFPNVDDIENVMKKLVK